MWALALALIALGLVPQTMGAVARSEIGVLRLTILEPLLLIGICVVLALANPEGMERLVARCVAAWNGLPRPVLLSATSALALGLAAGFSWYCFGRQPVLTDEFSQLFQSSLLLDGRLTARPEAFPEFFDTPQTARAGDRWFSEFPMGGPILLAVSRLAGVEWLLNPVLAAASVILIYLAVRRTHGETSARAASALFALSPFVLFMSASRMNHPMALGFQLLTLYGLARWQGATGRGAHTASAIIGAGLGAMVAIRPYDAVLIALPVGVFQLAAVYRSRATVTSLLTQILVGLVFVGGVLWANAATTGEPLVFGYDLVNGVAHRPGFHTDPMGREFTPRVGGYLASLYLTRLNFALFESPVPALVLVCATLLIMRRPMRWDFLHAGIIAMTVAGYAAYWFNGDFVGPRFLYPAVPSFVLFTARLGSEAVRSFPSWRAVRLTGLLVVPACILIAWAPIFVQGRPTGVWLRAAIYKRIPEASQPPVEADMREAGLSNALVFVREPLHARLAARLRGLGMPPYRAERAAADLDACALLEGLAAVDSARGLSRPKQLDSVLATARLAGPARPVRGLYGARSLSLAGAPSSGACLSQLTADSVGTHAYDAFLARATFDSLGRVGGPVVFARDLGPRNELLRARFGDRAWYRYRPRGHLSRTGETFVPY